MKKNLNASTVSILLLSIAFVIMSVGFAAYAQTLNINGTATAKKAEWNVQFDSTSYVESTGSIAATTHSLNTTAMNYTITLNPGEFYEFTVNVKNAGTIAATLKSITLSSLTEAQQKYIKYTVTYDGSAYSATTSGLSNELAADASKAVKVRVEYVFPDKSSDLPTEDVTLNLTASLDYVQKTA